MALTKVFEYGALLPTTSRAEVEDQMLLGHRFYNGLVAIERKRRENNAEIMRSYPQVDELEQKLTALNEQWDDLDKQVKRARAKTRSRTTAPELAAQRKELGTVIKGLRAELRTAKEQLRQDAEAQAKLMASNEEAHAAAKAHYNANANVYWGTRAIANQSYERAKASRTCNFRRWTGDGHLAVQVQGGIPTSEIFTRNTLCFIDPIDPSAWVKGTPGRRIAMRTRVHFRVSSTVGAEATETSPAVPGGKPIFATFPIVMHRPLPPGNVKWVHVVRRRLYDRTHWVVQFVVEMSPADVRPKKGGIGLCAMDVGWRLLPDGSLRVAVVKDEFGGRRELRLPAQLLSKDEHRSGLRSLRDKLFDAVKPSIGEWVKTANLGTDDTPQSVAAWKNPFRVMKMLREHGAAMPPELRAKLEKFEKDDRHLGVWEAYERRKVLNHRRELYRLFAVDLARTYSTVLMEKFNLSELAMRPKNKEAPLLERRVQYLRAFACISSLRSIVEQAFQSHNGVYRTMAAPYTTKACNACGNVDDNWNPATDLEHTCLTCGITWDQDDNSALNLIAIAQRMPPEEPPTPEEVAEQEAKALSARQSRFRKKKPEEGSTAPQP